MTVKFVAQIVTAHCSCGGQFMDDDASSYDITSDTATIRCDDCGKTASMNAQATKKATLFV